MSIKHHGMPRDLFEALARGGGGVDAALHLVAAQHSKHVILVAAVSKAAQPARRPDDRLAVAGHHLLAKVEKQDPAAARYVISYPSVGAWALHALHGDQAPASAFPSGLANVAAAAAIRAGIDAEIEVPVTNGTVALPSLGVADAEGPTALIRTESPKIRSGRLEVAVGAGSPGWQEIRSAQAGALQVLVDDLDPFRMPATDGEPMPRLTQPQFAAMTATLQDAWLVLDAASAAEIAALVRVIVPYQAPDKGHVSTSSPETFGTVAMSRQPDPYTCAETLVHEAQHLKLCALLDLVTITRPDDGRTYYAPWRDDPRPARGLLQGAYAYLGVAGFWRFQREAAADSTVRLRAEKEFARWRIGAWRVAETLLASGQLNSIGQDFVGQMARVLADWCREPVPSEALADARRKADEHQARWRAAHGDLPPWPP